MACASDALALIVDNGSAVCRAGFAGYLAPSSVFPSAAGEDECQAAHLRYPIEQGIITDWEAMEKLWRRCFFNELRASPAEHPVLVTEAPLNPKASRERMTQVLFEVFNAPAVYLATAAQLSLYASGRTTGVVVDCGDSVVHVVPLYEGYALPHAIKREHLLGGRELTDNFRRLLTERGVRTEGNIVREMKERLCRVALDLEEELQSAVDVSYELPGGELVAVGSERFRCPEALFQPCGEAKGLHEMVYDCIMSIDLVSRRDLYESVVLAGGGSLFPGMAQRMAKELQVLAPGTMSVEVLEPREHSAWCGGAMLAASASFRESWITRAEYEEQGPGAVHLKCF